MPEFLAETYTPHEVPDTAAPRVGDLARAAAHASRPGAPAGAVAAATGAGAGMAQQGLRLR